MEVTTQEIVTQDELQINLLKTFEFPSYAMGFHVYKDRWTPVKSEIVELFNCC